MAASKIAGSPRRACAREGRTLHPRRRVMRGKPSTMNSDLGYGLSKPGFQLMLWKGADALIRDFSVLEEQESRNAPDIISLRDVLIAVDIELDDLHFPVELLR